MDLPSATTKGAASELAVAYLRARDPSGVIPHRDLCQQAADRLGVQLVAEYTDIGAATKAQRPGLDHLLARLQEEPAVRFVLVTGLGQLFRSTRTALDVSEALTGAGAVLVDARHATVIGPLNLRLQAVVAAHVPDRAGQGG